MSKKNSNGKSSPLNVPYVWAFTTYFAEGLPYTIIRMVSSVFFRDMRVSLEAIGLTSLFGIPWVIKFLWGPLIDQFGTKRKWILIMQFLLVLLFLVVAVMSALPFGVTVIGGLLFFGAFLSATHDIAIDGYYMEALDKEGQAKFVGYRVMAYRLAMDTMTAGNLAAFAIEASKQGKIPDPLDCGNPDLAADLLHKIVRREGIGDLLAEGIKPASAELGSEDIVVHVKGMEPAGYDPQNFHYEDLEKDT